MAKLSTLGPPATLARLREHLRTPLFRNAYALVVNQALSAVLGVAYWMLAARLYQPEVVGRNAALISAMLFASFVSQLSLDSAATWFIPRAGRAAAGFVARAYLASTLVAGLLSAACVAGARMWGAAGAALGLTPELALWFALSAMIWCVFTIQDGVLTGLRQAVWVPAENAIYNILKVVLLIGLSGTLPGSGIFFAWSLPVPLLALAINWLIFRRLLPARPDAGAPPGLARQLASFLAGNYLGALFAEAATRLLPLLVVGLLGAAENAYFYQTWTLAAPLALVAWGMAASLTVEAAADRANDQRYGAQMLRQMLRVLVPAALLLALLAPVLLGLFGRSYAAEGVALLRLLALAALPNTLNIWYISLARACGWVRGILLSQIVLCLLVLGLSAALLPRYGITGVGWAWLIAQSAVAGLVALDLLRRRRLAR